MADGKDLINITRFDQEPRPGKNLGQHGWWVRVKRGGKMFQHFFLDSKYGGKEKCLEAAIVFRDAVKSQFLDHPNTDYIFSEDRTPSRRNKSGVMGVNRTAHSYTSKGHKYQRLVWQAHWPIGNGKNKNKSFSIQKYGEEGAFQLAYQARQEGLAKLTRALHPALLPPQDVNKKYGVIWILRNSWLCWRKEGCFSLALGKWTTLLKVLSPSSTKLLGH